MISGRVAPILIVALGQFVAPAVWHKLLRFSLPLNGNHNLFMLISSCEILRDFHL